MNYERFTQQEIPYDILMKFGLTQKMIDDLPENVTKRFLAGQTTPVLPILMENVEGQKVMSHARISLVRLKDGTVDVCFAPQWMDEDLKAFTQEQQEKLRLGEVTLADMPEKGQCYIQYDDAISQVMAVPVGVIDHNISILTHSFYITDEKKKKLQDGDIIELQINDNNLTARDEIISIGVDLNEITGIRIAFGDERVWKEDAKADRLPKYNFGIYGCWIADDENVLSYIAEEDYTDEIEQEMARKGSQRAAQEQLQQMKRN